MNTLAAATPASTPSHRTPVPHQPEIDHVMVCLDRSAAADGSLPWARFIAEIFDSKVTLLHVMPTPPGRHEPGRANALDWQLALREADQYLHSARESLGVVRRGAVSRLVQGIPPEQIVAMAHETGVDLTILTSRGESGRSAFELGSVAQRVLALGGGSILLVPPESPARLPPRRILVPLDGSPRSEAVLPIVTELARHHTAELVLVHVVTEPTSGALLSNLDDVQLASSLAARMEANAKEYLDRLRPRLEPQVSVVKTIVVRRADDRQAIVDLSVEHAVDMVACTAHGNTCNPERTFGSVASYLLAHAPLPLFILQDTPRAHPLPTADRDAPLNPSVRPPSAD